ncbi:MAG: hypothetical protein HKUEN01_13280 [Candidatus Kuenenia stuttgartiensis]|nr:MAG: hypothetical protein HKUEN01_13280 [Candidatus Kuenenia stuttgartiensis]
MGVTNATPSSIQKKHPHPGSDKESFLQYQKNEWVFVSFNSPDIKYLSNDIY